MYITLLFRVYILQDGTLILDVQVHGNWTEKLSVLNLICLGGRDPNSDLIRVPVRLMTYLKTVAIIRLGGCHRPNLVQPIGLVAVSDDSCTSAGLVINQVGPVHIAI